MALNITLDGNFSGTTLAADNGFYNKIYLWAEATCSTEWEYHQQQHYVVIVFLMLLMGKTFQEISNICHHQWVLHQLSSNLDFDGLDEDANKKEWKDVFSEKPCEKTRFKTCDRKTEC